MIAMKKIFLYPGTGSWASSIFSSLSPVMVYSPIALWTAIFASLKKGWG
jgi:hypothetical protein